MLTQFGRHQKSVLSTMVLLLYFDEMQTINVNLQISALDLHYILRFVKVKQHYQQQKNYRNKFSTM